MAKLFNTKIFTPEREFLNDDVEALTLSAPDGSLTILAGHIPMIAVVAVGVIKVKQNGQWREMVNSDGFLEVNHGGALVYLQACEWPEDIDARRAEEALKRAEEHLRQKQSVREYNNSKIALARAMTRLRVTKTHSK